MFNNPFLKKDPLIEAVKQARVEGDLRRQAEALVNEQFGVYSRNAVIRENLAAYDAALVEAYNDLKEGKKAKGSKHMFELSDKEVVNRKKAAKVAEKAGQVPKSVGKKLHSHDLRKAERIKKIKESKIK